LLIPLTGTGLRLACYTVGSAVIAGGIAVGNVIAGSFLQEYCPPEILGRVTASMRFLGTTLGVRNALWIVLGIYALSGTLLLTRAFRADKNRPAAAVTFAQVQQ
jgi:hypothetical protein